MHIAYWNNKGYLQPLVKMIDSIRLKKEILSELSVDEESGFRALQ